MTRSTFSAVRFALCRAQHRADLRRRRRRDIGAELIRHIGSETPERGGDPVLQLVQELVSGFRVAGNESVRYLSESVREQGKSDSARRCFEGFSAFLHATPLQHMAVGENVALGAIQASRLDPDPIASFARLLREGSRT